ncbi:ABC transporter C-terminal domain-containing protein [Corynebacterium kalinowskii]
MNALERKMGKLRDAVAKYNADMAVAAETMDTAKLTELNAAMNKAQDELDELEMQWLELGEELE